MFLLIGVAFIYAKRRSIKCRRRSIRLNFVSPFSLYVGSVLLNRDYLASSSNSFGMPLDVNNPNVTRAGEHCVCCTDLR